MVRIHPQPTGMWGLKGSISEDSVNPISKIVKNILQKMPKNQKFKPTQMMCCVGTATCHWLSPSVSSAPSVFTVVVASVLKSNRLHFALRGHSLFLKYRASPLQCSVHPLRRICVQCHACMSAAQRGSQSSSA